MPLLSRTAHALRPALAALLAAVAALAVPTGDGVLRARPIAGASQAPEVCSAAWLSAMDRSAMLDLGEALGLDLRLGLAGAGDRRAAHAEAPDYVEPAPQSVPSAADGALHDALEALPDALAGAAPSAEIQGLAQNLVRPSDAFFTSYQRLRYYEAGVLDAWQTTYGARDVTIAVISDGVDLSHDDLAPKIWRNLGEIEGNGLDDDGNGYVDDVHGYDVADGDPDPSPIALGDLQRSPIHVANRGTMMAGIAAAASNNGVGITGVAWGAKIMPLKVFIEYRSETCVPFCMGTYAKDQVEAICYASNNGADILLLGGFIVQDPNNGEQLRNLWRLQAAIQHAHEAGAVVVAGAGECGLPGRRGDGCPDRSVYGENPTILPAALEGVIGVQSHDASASLRSEASYGAWVDLVAPGQDMMTTTNTENPFEYEIIQNHHPRPSDFAAAFIAGTAGLMLSADDTLSPYRLEVQLCRTAHRDEAHGAYEMVGGMLRNDRYGCGLIDAEAAVTQMPWRVRVDAPELVHLVERDAILPRAPIGNSRLNAPTWEVREDVNWLWDEAQTQRTGAVARHDVVLDLDALRSFNGNRLSAGDIIRTRLRVCPNNPHNVIFHDERDCAPGSSSGCHCLDYAVHVVESLHRVFLPTATW